MGGERVEPLERCGDGGDRVVGQVHAVEDHLHDDIARHQRCACKPWFSSRERAHRVEEMRHRARAAVERLADPRPRPLGDGADQLGVGVKALDGVGEIAAELDVVAALERVDAWTKKNL